MKIDDKVPLKINKFREPVKVISDMGMPFFSEKTKIADKNIFLKDDFDELVEREVFLQYEKEGEVVEEKLIISSNSITDLQTDKGVIRYEDINVLIYPKSYSKSIFK